MVRMAMSPSEDDDGAVTHTWDRQRDEEKLAAVWLGMARLHALTRRGQNMGSGAGSGNGSFDPGSPRCC